MVGKRFGKQVVLRELGHDRVEIECDCGTIKTTRKQYLLNGQSRSCGCGRFADLAIPIVVGEAFTELCVIKKLGSNGHKREVLCLCSCGAHKVVTEDALRSGKTKSCGCFRRGRARGLNRTHGESGKFRTPLYSTWSSMWERTTKPKRWPSYVGIVVCTEWRMFEAFRDYANQYLGERPPGFSLDRIDNSLGYQPGNVQWAPAKHQARNRKSNTVVEVDGVRRCIAEWAEINSISSAVICARLKRGWDPKSAVTERRRRIGVLKP